LFGWIAGMLAIFVATSSGFCGTSLKHRRR
jgi:hypothetical protein